MPDFSELFKQANWQPIVYKDQKLILTDRFPVKDGDTLLIAIEKTNSDCRQGLCLDITGQCEFEGKIFKKGTYIRMQFWEDTAPKQIKLKIFTKKEFIFIENIWESSNYLGDKSTDSRRFGAAMKVEEIENGRRYRCNDWHPDENFDDIVFTVQRID
jgi:hypothetical protein